MPKLIRSLLMTVVLPILVMLSASPLATAQDSEVKRVEAAEAAMNAARAKADKAAYARLLHDDFIWITANGTVTNKQQQIDRLTPETTRSERRGQRITINGDTAVLTAATTRWPEGKPMRIFISRVFIRQDTEWKILLHQGSPIAAPN